jgi:hypothetical protein
MVDSNDEESHDIPPITEPVRPVEDPVENPVEDPVEVDSGHEQSHNTPPNAELVMPVEKLVELDCGHEESHNTPPNANTAELVQTPIEEHRLRPVSKPKKRKAKEMHHSEKSIWEVPTDNDATNIDYQNEGAEESEDCSC